MSLVAWPLNESEAGGDLALIETFLLFYVNDAVLMLICRNLHNKRSEVSIITRSPPASLSFKGQVARHTTVKRSIVNEWSVELPFGFFQHVHIHIIPGKLCN